jgi:antitoxin (DNA-binding transcriptional repressor) of toxin-antitoxin stability system
MTVIDLKEAKANLERYAVECQTSPVVVTQEGQPIFELLPIRRDDSGFLEDLIEQNPSFRDLVERAREDVRSGRVSSIESVRERLLGSESCPDAGCAVPGDSENAGGCSGSALRSCPPDPDPMVVDDPDAPIQGFHSEHG